MNLLKWVLVKIGFKLRMTSEERRSKTNEVWRGLLDRLNDLDHKWNNSFTFSYYLRGRRYATIEIDGEGDLIAVLSDRTVADEPVVLINPSVDYLALRIRDFIQ